MTTKTKVTNMISPQSGKEVANQFIIYTQEGEYFQSYQTVIAFMPYDNGPTLVDRDSWDYSATTLKYLKEFLRTNISKSEMEKEFEAGTWKLTDKLN